MRDSAFLRDNPAQAKTAYRKKACLHAICYKEIAPPLRASKKHHPHVLDAPLIAGIDGTVDSSLRFTRRSRSIPAAAFNLEDEKEVFCL